jgi:hypothetical protein
LSALPAPPLRPGCGHLRGFSPRLGAAGDGRGGAGAKAGKVEIAGMPAGSSWLNRMEAQFTALRYFAPGRTGRTDHADHADHASHKEQASRIRRCIIWPGSRACGERPRRIAGRANAA